MNLTDPQYNALHIVALNGPIRPSRFADKMWPDSPAHQISYKCGAWGSTRGRGLVLSAGSYLAKLRKRGWVKEQYYFFGDKDYRNQGNVLTKEGEQVYKEEYHRRRQQENDRAE